MMESRKGDGGRALKYAIAMQRGFEEHNETRRGGSRTAPTAEPIRVRVGVRKADRTNGWRMVRTSG